MDCNKIMELYKIVREKNDINNSGILTKGFILTLLNAPQKCFSSDLEALKFLLETRINLIESKFAA